MNVRSHFAQVHPNVCAAKKKEPVGEYKNGRREWQPVGEPEVVKVHDFIDPDLGKAVPCGVYDVANDEGWVSVGETAATGLWRYTADPEPSLCTRPRRRPAPEDDA